MSTAAQIKALNPIEVVIGRYVHLKPNGNWLEGICPFHDDHDPSLHVSVKKQVFKCQACGVAGSVVDFYARIEKLTIGEALRKLDPSPNTKQSNKPKPAWLTEGKFSARYSYKDETGRVLFVKDRYIMPDGSKQTPCGRVVNDEFRGVSWPNLNCRDILYRLDEIAAAKMAVDLIGAKPPVIHLHEGEKPADRAVLEGLLSTSTRLGATGPKDRRPKWKPEYTEQLQGAKEVVLWADNDDQGIRHMILIGSILAEAKIPCRIVKSATREKGDDAFEHFNAGFKAEQAVPVIWDPVDMSRPTVATEGLPEIDPDKINEAAQPDFAHWTDRGSGNRFVHVFGADIRWVHLWDKFLAWDGNCWIPDETGDVPVISRIDKLADEMWQVATDMEDEEERKAYLKFIKEFEMRGPAEAISWRLKHESSISVTPGVFDVDPWLLSVRNGTVDLRTGAIREHKRDDMVTRSLDFEYDPTAKCPQFDEFLLDIMSNDREMVAYIWRMIGYFLTGDVSEQKVFFMHGSGSNGKGVLVTIIEKLLAGHATTITADTLMVSNKTGGDAPTPELAKLWGARLAIAGELPDNRRFDEAKVKWLSGADTLTAARKFEHPFTFTPTHKLLMSANSKPDIRGNDNGIWRRYHLIPFLERYEEIPTIGARKLDPGLALRLQTEMQGILARAIEGCREWQSKGLAAPSRVLMAVAQYRADSDTVGRFLQEKTIAEEGAKMLGSEIYELYCSWCFTANIRPDSSIKFGTYLTSRKEFAEKGRAASGVFYIGRRARHEYDRWDYTEVVEPKGERTQAQASLMEPEPDYEEGDFASL